MKRVALRLDPLDFALSGFGAMLAVFSAGVGISLPAIGIISALAIMLGTVTSFGLSGAVADKPPAKSDGFIYAFISIVVALCGPQLNSLLPGGGFPDKLTVAGVLCWMLMAGSFVTWRDQTLLFQAVPSIALFGLVGSWETFSMTPVLFFVFLLCLAALFARAHARSMLVLAVGSSRLAVGEERDFEALFAGPWRSMAGPEWALVSAAAVILISLLGAPMIQQSVRGVSGAVQFAVPLKTTPPPVGPGAYRASLPLQIGRGPRTLHGTPVLKIKLGGLAAGSWRLAEYLRGTAYSVYEPGGWRNSRLNVNLADVYLDELAGFMRPYDPRKILSHPAILSFEERFLAGQHDNLYVPGELWQQLSGPELFILPNGTVRPTRSFAMPATVSATALVPDASVLPVKAATPPILDPSLANLYTDTSKIKTSIRALASEVTAKASSDYAKAIAIKEAIEERATYNLEAGATPDAADPVEYFLFESKEGYCDLFASAMALMARAAGLPSRVATGFVVNRTDQDSEGFLTLRDSDYHAWAEIFFAGVGWVPFDPTEGAQSRGSPTTELRPWYESAWVYWVGGLGFGLLALWVFWTALKGWRVGGWRLSVRPVRDPVAIAYVGFQRELARRTRTRRRFSETPREYLERIKPLIGSVGREAETLTSAFESALYSSNGFDHEQSRDLTTRLRSFKRSPKG